MEVPSLLGYIMLLGSSIFLLGLGVTALAYFGGFLLNVIFPNIWIIRTKQRVKRMSPDELEAFILAIRTDWKTFDMNKKEK